jgi:hypothetical protein
MFAIGILSRRSPMAESLASMRGAVVTAICMAGGGFRQQANRLRAELQYETKFQFSYSSTASGEGETGVVAGARVVRTGWEGCDSPPLRRLRLSASVCCERCA